MEDERFDALLRGLGRGASRRGALGVLAGLAGLAGLGVGEAAAKRHRPRAPKAAKHKANHGDFKYDVAAGECGNNGICEPRFETCTAQTQICDIFDAPHCGSNSEPGCACFFTFEDGDPQGPRLCTNFFSNVCADHYGPCQDHADCNDGDICASTCCNDVAFGPGGICVPACGHAPSSAARRGSRTQRASRTENGPTLTLPPVSGPIVPRLGRARPGQDGQ
jgi:hypothetical protein